MKSDKFNVTADQIKGLLVERYGDAYKYAIAAEVSPRTGAWERRVDFMAFHCWDSENFELEAFEIKISKSDLKRELMDPSKHNCLFDLIEHRQKTFVHELAAILNENAKRLVNAWRADRRRARRKT